MQIEQFEQSGWTVVQPAGDFAMYNVYTIKNFMNQLLARGVRQVAIDLDKTTYIDSAGIGALIHVHKKVIDFRGDFFVYGGSEDVRKVFTSMNVDQVIRLEDSFEEGIAA
jgi:anti-sigma B factor antagonist